MSKKNHIVVDDEEKTTVKEANKKIDKSINKQSNIEQVDVKLADIKKHLPDGDKIISLFDDYYEKIKPIVADRYEDETSFIQKTIATFPKQMDDITSSLDDIFNITDSSKTDSLNLCKNIFIFANNLQTFNSSMMQIVQLFNKPYLNVSNVMGSDVSQTYRDDAVDLLYQITQDYESFRVDYERNITVIDNLLSSLILQRLIKEKNITDKKKIIVGIQQLFREYPKSINLYAEFLQRYIDILYLSDDNENKQLMFYVISLIEQDKDYCMSGLASSELPDKVSKQIHLKNPFLHRYGLVNNTESLPMPEVFGMLLQQKITSIDSFVKQNKKHGLIIMYKVIPAPIEYTVRRLFKLPNREENTGINVAFVNACKLIQQLGVIGGKLTNEEMRQNIVMVGDTNNQENEMDQDNTNNTNDNTNDDTNDNTNDDIGLDKTVGGAKWNFDIKIYNPDSENFFILDTLDGVKFRILTPYFSTKVYSVPKYRVEQLIKYATDGNPPNRITNYQTLAGQVAISNMFASRVMPIDYLEEQSKEVDTPMIRNELYLKLTKHVNKLVNKQIKSQADINNIIHDSMFQTIFVDTLFNIYQVSGNKVTLTNGFKQGELLSSFILSLQDTAKQFFKIVHDGYNRDPLGYDVFKLPEEDRILMIEKKINDVLLKCLNMLISDKDNIFAAANYKYLMLTFE